MRRLLVCSITSAALAVTASSAGASRPHYANFKVTVNGIETTSVNGRQECEDAAGTIAAAKATQTAKFSTSRSTVLQFYKVGKSLSVIKPNGLSTPKVVASGSVTRQSDYGPAGSQPPPACGGPANSGCGTTTLPHIVLVVQPGRVGEVSLLVDKPQLSDVDCPVPMLSFPDIVGTTDPGRDEHVTYSAKIPRGLLNRHKRVLVIHGKGIATRHGRDGGVYVDSGTTSLSFTMRLVRVPFR
jgi:hypothetical protein